MNRNRTLVAALAATGLTMGSVGLLAMPASAVLPTLPDNLVVFPDRDFVTVEGFDMPGSPATLRVYRGDTVIGQSSGLIEGGGEVAFEVNHPGGWCWGQGEGAAFQVTPDIQGDDRVEIELTAANDGRVFDVPVADIEVLEESVDGNTVTTVSKVPADVTDDRIEARIIAPDLNDTAVGRRDARATFDSTGDDGYTSSLARDADGNVVATWSFVDADGAPDPAAAQIAVDGSSRIMSWAVTAPNGDRLGITIAEQDELGGPGMGGCPLGPNDAQAPAPGNATVTLVGDGSSATVDWTPSVQVAGAPAITGYQVTATDPDGNIVGRNEAATATRSTLTGLPAGNLTFEVRAATGDSLSKPFAVTQAVPPAEPGGDTTPPALNAPTQAADGSVTLSSPDGTAEIWYTADGSAVQDGGVPSVDAIRYTGPIPVTEADTVISFMAIDPAGNTSFGSGVFQPAGTVTPDPLEAPSLSSAVGGQGSVSLQWTQVPDATSYQVDVSPAPAAGQPGSTTARVQQVNGLDAGTEYTFTVKALATNRESPVSNALTATPTAVLSQPEITRAQFRAARDFRIEGVTDVTSGTVQIFRFSNGAPTGNPIGGTLAVTPAVAPEVGGVFAVRLRNGAVPGTNPGQIVAVADDGAVSAPFTVENR